MVRLILRSIFQVQLLTVISVEAVPHHAHRGQWLALPITAHEAPPLCFHHQFHARICCLEDVTNAHSTAHITDIFSLAATSTSLLSASGSSTLHVHSTKDQSFPLAQSLSNAHKLGCHHIAVSRNGKVAASAGFGGEVKIWKQADTGSGDWEAYGELDTTGGANGSSAKKAGEVWAIALSEDGAYLAATTYDGRINVWSLETPQGKKIQEYETGSAGSGTFGLCVDLSRDGKWTASGHQNGSVYVFNNDTGKIQYSLPGKLPLRAREKSLHVV